MNFSLAVQHLLVRYRDPSDKSVGGVRSFVAGYCSRALPVLGSCALKTLGNKAFRVKFKISTLCNLRVFEDYKKTRQVRSSYLF